jgi:DNA polymerase-3 subunit gamma/tau
VTLSLIKEEVIAGRLAEILALEGVQAEAGVLDELARAARGSMRDALSLTDQLLSLVGEKPALADVRRLAGPASGDLVLALCASIRAGDAGAILAALARLDGGAAELAGALLEHLRLALLAVLAPAEAALFAPDEGRRAALATFARDLGPDRLQLWLQELLAARERMALLPEHARIVLEVTLLDLARAEVAMPIGELAGRLEALEQRLGAAPAPKPSPTNAAPLASAAPAAKSTLRPPAPAPRTQRPVAGEAPAAEKRAQGASAPPDSGDAFTRQVADLFTGRIET